MLPILTYWFVHPGLAWIIIPLPISFDFYGIRYNSWRLFLGAISLPIFTIAIVILSYPESPKFLVSQGKTNEALAILRTIYAVNTGRDKSEFPVSTKKVIFIFQIALSDYIVSFLNQHATYFQVKELLSDAVFEVEKDKAPLSSSDMLTELLKNIWWQLRTIASPPLLKYASVLWMIYFTNMFGWVSL